MAKSTTTPYYQPVLDALATTGAIDKSPLLATRDLCIATETGNRIAVRRAVNRIVKEFTSTETQLHIIPDAVWHETMFRLLEMGETALMLSLIKWYRGFLGSLQPKASFEGNNWEGMIECVSRPEPSLAPEALQQYWAMIERALAEAIPVFIKSPAPKPRSAGRRDLPLHTALRQGLIVLFECLINAFQLFLDRAIDELASSGVQRDSQMARLHRRWFGTRSRLLPSQNASPLLLSLQVPMAKVQEGRDGFSYLDAFVPHKSRHFPFNFYKRGDDTAEDPESKHYFLRDLIRFIDNKLNFYLDQLGVPHEKPNLKTKREKAASAKVLAERRKIVKKARLETDTDLAQFACLLYHDHLHNPPKNIVPTQQDAWTRAIDFLRRYLATQTTHTSFNLDERPKYVDRLFPRAINGGQIHDCGVYAVRMVNILLQFAACTAKDDDYKIGLDISFVILPLHVGLIVQAEGLQPTFVHNQVVVSMTPQQESDWFDEWKNGPWKQTASDPDPADSDKEKQKFWEDVAAQLFLRDIDMPLMRLDVRGVNTPPRKGQVDGAYKRLVVKNYSALFSPRIAREGTDEFNFDFLFLDALAMANRWFNAQVLKLWNLEAKALFLQFSKDGALRKSARVRDLYADALEAKVQEVDDAYDKLVRPKNEEVSQLLRAKQQRVLGRKAQRVTLSMRLRQSATSIGPVGEIRQHIHDIRNGTVQVPRFAIEGEFLTPLIEH